ncbi:MAG: TetR/AcrR family transcriptional regulator [Granulosicoccaceae bacterium]
MPRPSKRDERREEILKAYGRCLARFGVEGSTLERVANEAGLARALIRHNVGNKDELLLAFVEYFIAQDNQNTDAFFADLPKKNRVKALVRYLFDFDYPRDDSTRIGNALLTAGSEHPALAAKLRAWPSSFIRHLDRELASAFPEAKPRARKAVAAGIASIYINCETWSELGEDAEFRSQSLHAVDLLLASIAE